MGSKLLGVENLAQAFAELGAMTGSEWKAALRAGVQTPMRKVKDRAETNVAKISPGKALMHKTYRGRLVGAGFAARSLRIIVKFSKGGGSATAILGVRAEAFYALQFFERGTSTIRAQPWLVPAFETSQETAVQDVGDAIVTRIETIAAKRMASSPPSGT